jgi:hypothetical protein
MKNKLLVILAIIFVIMAVGSLAFADIITDIDSPRIKPTTTPVDADILRRLKILETEVSILNVTPK